MNSGHSKMATNGLYVGCLSNSKEHAQTEHTGYIRLYSHVSTQPTQPLTLIVMRTNANSSPSRCSPRESVSSLTAPPCLPKTRPSLQLHLLPNEQHAPHAMMLDFDTRQHELTGPLHEHELVHQMTC